MKGLMFRPAIWQAKQRVLETHGIAVTRRLNGLKEINREPNKWQQVHWGLPYTGHFTGGLFLCRDAGIFRLVDSRYQVGDVVYIKEAWATEKKYNHLKPSEIPPDAYIHFVADGVGDYPLNITLGRWRSPMFMPEWAARYHIKITDVRPELFSFQDMTAEELELEGGGAAVGLLKKRYDGKWVWEISFTK